uniref:Proteasome activator complex subunit 3 n=1 Tax=Gallus gallus TaxID=9031 RepID=A0A8V0ZPP1_CHICK
MVSRSRILKEVSSFSGWLQRWHTKLTCVVQAGARPPSMPCLSTPLSPEPAPPPSPPPDVTHRPARSYQECRSPSGGHFLFHVPLYFLPASCQDPAAWSGGERTSCYWRVRCVTSLPAAAEPVAVVGWAAGAARGTARPGFAPAAMASLLKVDPEVKLKVDSFRERITSEAEDLVANFFPKKLLELDGFLKEPILNIHDLTQIHSDMNLPVPDPILLTNSHDGLDGPNMKKRKLEDREETFQGTKVFVMPNGMLKSNQQLVDIIEKVKPEIRLLIEKCNTVKMWVQLLIPRIEDGNNFGVSIQEETVAELRTVESEAASYLDQISRYYITRAKLVSKIAKYPHVEDYRRTVTEIDEKEYISLRLIISELRNQYVTLHDMILKNIEKIKRPRSSNAETLY